MPVSCARELFVSLSFYRNNIGETNIFHIPMIQKLSLPNNRKSLDKRFFSRNYFTSEGKEKE